MNYQRKKKRKNPLEKCDLLDYTLLQKRQNDQVISVFMFKIIKNIT